MGVVQIDDWRPAPAPDLGGPRTKSAAAFRDTDAPVRSRHPAPTRSGLPYLDAGPVEAPRRQAVGGPHGNGRQGRHQGSLPAGSGSSRDLGDEGRVLVLPLEDRHREAVLEFCRNDAEGGWRVLKQGEAVLFARTSDFAFASFLAL